MNGLLQSPYHTENPHLFNALVHRKDGNFPAALTELKLACEQNDPDAKFLLFYIYYYGGLGLRPDTIKYKEYFKSITESPAPPYLTQAFYMEYNQFKDFVTIAVQSKSVLAPFLFVIKRDYYFIFDEQFKEYVQLCCQWNDPYILFLTHELDNLLLSIKQCVYHAYQPAINIYYERLEYLKAAKIIVQKTNPSGVYRNIKYALATKYRIDREKQCFVFGRWLSKRQETERLCHIFVNSIRIYQETMERVEKTMNCWIWACGKMGIYRDLRKMIGNLVWESREDPQAWGIGLERRSGRRKKVRK
jgi:hypothetical protein